MRDPQEKKVTVSDELLKEWLGNPRYKKTVLDVGIDRIGLATGLAWTEMGGDLLEIEVTVLPGKGGLTLTGQLGDVMQESAHAALSYIRSRAEHLGLKESFYSAKDIHVHIPEGATPKDGPSAGITMCLALISALTKNPTRSDVAMTGEITLRGRVIAVGGLKEKILAARQHGMKMVLVPDENKDDVEEILKDIGKHDHLEIVFVKNMDEVLTRALVNNPFNHPVHKEKKKNKDQDSKKKKEEAKSASKKRADASKKTTPTKKKKDSIKKRPKK